MWVCLIKFFKKNERYIYLEYGVLSLLILWPLLTKGYVFAMDMAWPPKFVFPSEVIREYLVSLGLWGLGKILPVWIIQKLFLFFTIFLAGVGAHKLVRTKQPWPKYFAGFLFVLSPFFYSRFLFGQLFFLLAFALLPFFARRALDFFKHPNWKDMIWLAVLISLIVPLSPHYLFFLILFLIISVMVYFSVYLYRRNFSQIKKLICLLILLIIISLALNSYWLIPQLNGTVSTLAEAQMFGPAQNEAFLTDSGETNIFFNVASLYGFWGDRASVYVLPKEINPLWWIFAGLIVLIVLWGIISGFKRKKIAATLIFTILIIISAVLAVGIAAKPLAPFIEWLNNHFSFYRGFREPQKFVGLIVLSYCYLGARGLADLSVRLRKKKEWLTGLAIVIVIFCNPLMFNGARGQLFVADYPVSWYETKAVLNADVENFKVLFLPWHQYMSFDFARDKVLANPAPTFFDKEILAGDNMELALIESYSQRPFSKFFENEVLQNKNTIQNLGEQIKKWDIKYILLAKEVDWAKYDFLNQQSDLQLIKTYPDLLVYENKKY